MLDCGSTVTYRPGSLVVKRPSRIWDICPGFESWSGHFSSLTRQSRNTTPRMMHLRQGMGATIFDLQEAGWVICGRRPSPSHRRAAERGTGLTCSPYSMFSRLTIAQKNITLDDAYHTLVNSLHCRTCLLILLTVHPIGSACCCIS